MDSLMYKLYLQNKMMRIQLTPIFLKKIKKFFKIQKIHRIIKHETDGLTWRSDYKIEPVAFGINKLVIGCVVEDEKVCVDDVIDFIQESEEDVIQGVDIRNHGCGI
eukprot:403354491